MRHAKARLTLNRFTSWRKSTLISIAKSLLTKQRIMTTKTKAKAAIPLIERLIGLGKENSLTKRRNAYRILGEHRLVNLLFKEISPRFNNRKSGFIRILPWGFRRSDGAEMVILELTEQKEKVVRSKKEKPATKTEIKETEKPQSPEAKPKVFTKDTKEQVLPTKKPTKKFLGGIRKIFKKERDSL